MKKSNEKRNLKSNSKSKPKYYGKNFFDCNYNNLDSLIERKASSLLGYDLYMNNHTINNRYNNDKCNDQKSKKLI